MDFRLSDDQQVLRRSVREFAEAEIGPHVMEWDEAQAFPAELVAKMAALGLMGIQFPEAYGGSAMSAVDYCLCLEELARVCPAVALSVAAHNGLCSAHIYHVRHRGAEAAVPAAARQAARCSARGASPSPPPAATPPARARPRCATATAWVINGAKTFITHGAIGGMFVAMAVTDRARGNRGISAFIIERGTPGMRPGKKENKLGMRASDTSEVVFTDCRVPADQLLGEEGQGFVNAMQVLDAGRIGIAALSVGLAQGAYEAAREVRAGAAAVRTADRGVPGDAVEDRGPRDAHRSGAPADLSRGRHARSRRTHDAAVGDGQAVLERSGGAGRGGVRADPRRLRLREGLSRREIFPRRQTAHHRRRHERDPAARHRPSAARRDRHSHDARARGRSARAGACDHARRRRSTRGRRRSCAACSRRPAAPT